MGKGEKSVRFSFRVPNEGMYHVLIAYTPGGSREKQVPVTVLTADGSKTVHVDQSKKPSLSNNFLLIGEFRFEKDTDASVLISNEGTTGHVIADAIQIVTAEQYKLVVEIAKRPPVVVKNNKKPKGEEPAPPAPKFERQPTSREVTRLTPAQLDELVITATNHSGKLEITDDVAFLRRATLDLIGRPPNRVELFEFLNDDSTTKRFAALDRLLASEEYGKNWGNYWCDVISYRQQEPQLTFHNYTPFKKWLAEEFNADVAWDEVVYKMITARGKVGTNPEATFIGFHQGNSNRIAGETARVFLSQKISCAECHDHPFVDMPQETFHGVAAYFARTEAKIAQNDSNGIEVKSKDKGEHKIPGKKQEMQPVAFKNDPLDLGVSDMDRRVALAYWIVNGDNRFFAQTYVNRVWERLVGRGFSKPIDDLGELAEIAMPEVLEKLADEFVAANFDHRSLFRLVMRTRVYQRRLLSSDEDSEALLARGVLKKLRSDEVFASLETAINLPNVTPEQEQKTGAVRFPPPSQSTRDLVNEAFGYDPSFRDDLVVRTMKQAMFMMNNVQIQKQIDASPESDTFLSKLLKEQSDNRIAVIELYEQILARRPTIRELKLVVNHIANIDGRGEAFEDILWSLLNSAEFTTRY